MAKTTANYNTTVTGPIDCACVIHGDVYSWSYVEKLYSMLTRHVSVGIRLHVYTESDRAVPEPFIKHALDNWGISGPKLAWWYKMQLFNTAHHAGPLLYLDLDTVIVKNIDWIWNLPTRFFWTVKDFKHLWRPNFNGMNSSVMWWDTRNHETVWHNFRKQKLDMIIKQHHGDQDFLTQNIHPGFLRFFDQNNIKSWRWQCLDGGYDFKRRMYLQPNSGTIIPENCNILIFHGKPKPLDIVDPCIQSHWQ